MYIVYKVINNINGKYYLGVHKGSDDKYLGSGRAIKQAVKKYGRVNFTRQTIASFDSKIEAFEFERVLVEKHLRDPMCYNMMSGGLGGFEHINSNPNRINPMHVEEYRLRNKENSKKRLMEDEDWAARKKIIAKNNLQKAVIANTGKKRPEHSKIMKEKSPLLKMWENKEQHRNLLASEFEVVSPDGLVYNTNRLEDFCKEHELSYVSVWNTSRTNKPVTKGRSKGWQCKKI